MIAQLRGKPVRRGAEGLVLDVGGVGYLVQATPRALAQAGRSKDVTVETYLHVREDALQLYGFADTAERELFEQLLSVSGVGPKVALAIVSGSTPAELRRAIAREDTARFEAIPGIGRKTAQRVVLELKGSLAVEPRRIPRRVTATSWHATPLSSSDIPSSTPSRCSRRSIPALPPEERVRQALRQAA